LNEAAKSTPILQKAKLDDLINHLSEIRRAPGESETALEIRLDRIHPTYLKSARNLAHYIALRHYDIRSLQEKLNAITMVKPETAIR
jgi:pyruvate kinase